MSCKYTRQPAGANHRLKLWNFWRSFQNICGNIMGNSKLARHRISWWILYGFIFSCPCLDREVVFPLSLSTGTIAGRWYGAAEGGLLLATGMASHSLCPAPCGKIVSETRQDHPVPSTPICKWRPTCYVMIWIYLQGNFYAVLYWILISYQSNESLVAHKLFRYLEKIIISFV